MPTKYRIVTDRYGGFEVQCKPSWWPFWSECESEIGCCNTYATVEEAEQFARDVRDGAIKRRRLPKLGAVVKYL